jgi:biopolymer transport protein ExbD
MNLKRRNKVSAEFNMSSMTDIVFYYWYFHANIDYGNNYNALDLVLPKSKRKDRQ